MNETESSPNSSSDTLLSCTDTVVAALADHRRRAVLTYFQQAQSGDATVEELASSLAERDDGQSSTPPDTEGRNIRISLHHTHLPKLADANLISYDPDQGRVRDQSNDWVADLLATIENG